MDESERTLTVPKLFSIISGWSKYRKLSRELKPTKVDFDGGKQEAEEGWGCVVEERGEERALMTQQASAHLVSQSDTWRPCAECVRVRCTSHTHTCQDRPLAVTVHVKNQTWSFILIWPYFSGVFDENEETDLFVLNH